ncbi:MAG: hypothetical protein U1E89_04605 [Burkholderiaceae bacterium]
MSYRVTHNFRAEAAHLASMARQIPFATANAINDTLFEARREAIRAMSVFDRPTQFTLHGPRVEKASKTDLAGQLVIPTVRGSAGAEGEPFATLPAGKPVLAEVQGGARRFKRSEVLLQRKGILPRGMYAVPGRAARLDSYGNIEIRQLLHILAYFEAYGPRSRRGRRMAINTTAEGRTRLKQGFGNRKITGGFGVEYFAVQPGDKGLAPGIYERRLTTERRKFQGPAQRVRAVLLFVTGAHYTALYRFHDAVRRTVVAQYEARFAARLEQAMSSAR